MRLGVAGAVVAGVATLLWVHMSSYDSGREVGESIGRLRGLTEGYARASEWERERKR